MNRNTLQEIRSLLPNCLLRDRRRLERQLESLGHTRRLPESALAQKLGQWQLQAERSAAERLRRLEQRPQVSYPGELPITARSDDIIAAIKANPVVVIAGETGSGKTTQIPKMCLDAGLGINGRIGCTQPRRVAALSISRRVARELNVAWGHAVGCKIRFTDESSRDTIVKFMTDGILLAETQADRELEEYDVLIIDEAHERSLNIDFLLGYLNTLLPRRPDLKVIITSATIDTEAFSRAFNNAPVIEVSGRMFPVDVRYRPHDPDAEDRGDLTYIDATVSAVDEVLEESESGDILIFMPGERDIRETIDDLKGRHGKRCELLPMFGRLSASEQENVFASCARRKIIVATNIAETSLTIPGIRYVIDPGLVRMSRYSPRTRTRRLPIEPVSQSSANQRAGRAGRLENGVCLRLYDEEDFEQRPRFTQPEIQRCNLAEVILRMKAFQLGNIETFPFINPPMPQAIQSGYKLLQELGALDEQRDLTPLGRQLARLPVDPSIGRMILQSVTENAVDDVLIIAAGMSIQDPRERPHEKRAEADEAHRQFQDPDSDFLSLLRIWKAYHDTWDSLRTQNQLRKFCKSHFLAYMRMREWRDTHSQLGEALSEARKPPRKGRSPKPARADAKRPTASRKGPDYNAIHRSILTGLLGHVARRHESNIYKSAGNREVMIFPGSSLFDRREDKNRARRRRSSTDEPEAGGTGKVQQPEWIVSGEIMETSRLFARTAARIEPSWIVELASHLIRRRHFNPQWVRKSGRVLARERITLFGLLVQETNVDYGRVNPQEATEIFIRNALVAEDIDTPHRFLEHNRQVRQHIGAWRTRSREAGLPNADTALFEFYAERLSCVSSVHDLNRVMREQLTANPDFLCASESDLTGGREVAWDTESFPLSASVAGETVRLEYAYAPGETNDGCTVHLPVTLAHRARPEMLDWIVPGLREDQVAHLVKALPKSIRVRLMPTGPKVKALAGMLKAGDGLDRLRELIHDQYGIDIPPRTWTRESLPDYLRVRVSILSSGQTTVAAGRDLEKLQQNLEQHETPAEQRAWTQATLEWERYDLEGWTFGDPPETIEVTTVSGSPLHALPGLSVENGAVHLKLFRQRAAAEQSTSHAWIALAEQTLKRELAWLQKDLHPSSPLATLYVPLGNAAELQQTAYFNLRRHLFPLPHPVLPLRQATFEQMIEAARETIPTLATPFLGLVQTILQRRQEAWVFPRPYPGMQQEVSALVPPRFLERIAYERLPDLPRYLKAMRIRAERAALSPAKDQEKAARVAPYIQAVARWSGRSLPSWDAWRALEQLYWLVEEYKVSIFAQELGTAQPVSPKRLNALIEVLERE